MGIRFGADLLQENKDKLAALFPLDKYCQEQETSLQLQALCGELEQHHDIKEARIIVFVQTRAAVKRLVDFLLKPIWEYELI